MTITNKATELILDDPHFMTFDALRTALGYQMSRTGAATTRRILERVERHPLIEVRWIDGVQCVGSVFAFEHFDNSKS